MMGRHSNVKTNTSLIDQNTINKIAKEYSESKKDIKSFEKKEIQAYESLSDKLSDPEATERQIKAERRSLEVIQKDIEEAEESKKELKPYIQANFDQFRDKIREYNLLGDFLDQELQRPWLQSERDAKYRDTTVTKSFDEIDWDNSYENGRSQYSLIFTISLNNSKINNGNEMEIETDKFTEKPTKEQLKRIILASKDKANEQFADSGEYFYDSFTEDMPTYIKKLVIREYYDANLHGAYHFINKGEEVQHDYELFVESRGSAKIDQIFTSNRIDNDCLFYTYFAGLNRYCNIKIKEPQSIINNFRIAKGLFGKISYDNLYQLHNSLYDFKFEAVSTNYSSFSNNKLRLHIFNHSNHAFLCRPDDHEYIQNNFIPTLIVNTESKQKNLDIVKIIRAAELKQVIKKEGKCGQDFLWISYDIETFTTERTKRITPFLFQIRVIARKNGVITKRDPKLFKNIADTQKYIERVIREHRAKNINIYAWNGMKFDFPLSTFSWSLVGLSGAEEKLPVFRYEYKIDSTKYTSKITCLDAMKLIAPTSLKNACKAYEVTNKLDSEPESFFDTINKFFNGKDYEYEYSEEIKAKLLEEGKTLQTDKRLKLIQAIEIYGIYDVISQGELLLKFCDLFENMKDIEPLYPMNFTSSAGISGFYLNNEVKHKVEMVKSSTVNKAFRKRNIGGRTLMNSCYYDSKIIPTKQNWNSSLRKSITYIDAISLYPSAMYLFKYPTKLIRAKHRATELLNSFIEKAKNAKAINEIDEIFDNDITYLVDATVTPKGGFVPCIPKNSKDGLLYHMKPQTGIFSLVDVIRSIYFNKADIEVHACYEYKNEYIFQFIKKLFDLRLKAKKAGNTILSNTYKLIMNGMYGKSLSKIIDGKYTAFQNKNKELMNIKKYNNNTLYKYYQTDNSGNMYHVSSFILGFSKYLMDRVIDCLGGSPGNFFTQKYPFFATDTDSMAVYVQDFEEAKRYLSTSKIPIDTDEFGGFHIDVEAPQCEHCLTKQACTTPEKCADKSFVAYVKRACWICAKTYILECYYVNRLGEVKQFHHIRGKGLKHAWLKDMTVDDYLTLSQKEDRSVKDYALKKGWDDSKYWQFNIKPQLVEINNIWQEFDRAFPHYTAINKHKEFSEEIYKNMLVSGKPILLKSL